MIKKIYLRFEFDVFLLVTVSVFYSDGVVSFKWENESIEIRTIFVVLAFIGFIYLSRLVRKISGWAHEIFSRKPSYEKGLEYLQLAFSGLLVKDKDAIERTLKKAEKHLGEIPLISWLKGQQSLINGDEHRAKAIFYTLCEKEKNTAFGAYSLCQLTKRSDTNRLNAIGAVLKVYPHAQDLILQGIAIALKSKHFEEAKQQASRLPFGKEASLIEAVIYSEEGIEKKDPELLERAFELAPELSRNAINYAEFLAENEEYKNARRVLRKSFMNCPNQKVFDKYISIDGNLSNFDKIKLAKKIIDCASESWIGYFELSKMLIQEGMMIQAFYNLLIAYEKGQYDFIANALTKIADQLNDPKPVEAQRIIANPLKSKHVRFVWKCSHCGTEESDWMPVCKYCNRIAGFKEIAVEMPLFID